MAREIALTRGYVALVDDEDFDWLSRWKWIVHTHPRGYDTALRCVPAAEGGGQVKMHRAILGARPGLVVDHINGNTLDNRRCNLRLCTHAENMRNRRPHKNNAVGFKGVNLHANGSYVARIRADGRNVRLGTFACPVEAARAYDAAARRFHGEFARLNFPEAA